MENSSPIKGRPIVPTGVEFVEHGGADSNETIFDFLRRIPCGTPTRENIDRQIREERDSWRER